LAARFEYDELPYDDFPFSETHPAHLSALGALFGLTPAPPDRCRLLELGCGRAGNLLPMAATLPHSRFAGVDLSSMHIAVAKTDIEALCLPNIQVNTADIRDLDDSLGTFDYVVCHGVYSWVPEDVQQHILRVCRSLLAPDGIAYVSYNTLPGWHLRGLVRDILLLEAGRDAPADVRIARARDLLGLLAHLPAKGAAAWIRGEVELLSGMSDAYLLYEHLAQNNRPVYFRDFAESAAQKGLLYITDAHDWARSTDKLAPDARDWIEQRSRSLLDTEHYMDLLEPRFFRRSLLCHREREIDRRITWTRLKDLWLSSDLAPDTDPPQLDIEIEETFSAPENVVLTAAPPLLRAALRALHGSPRGMPFGELVSASHRAVSVASHRSSDSGPSAEELDRLGGNLLGLAAQGMIELLPGPRPYSAAAGERPEATVIARRQAAQGAPGCTTLRHRRVAVDRMDRSLLSRMDGRTDRAGLVAGVLEDIECGSLQIEAEGEKVRDAASVEELVRQKLDHLARMAFLLPCE
jgi:SAM-dependent methyltransferase